MVWQSHDSFSGDGRKEDGVEDSFYKTDAASHRTVCGMASYTKKELYRQEVDWAIQILSGSDPTNVKDRFIGDSETSVHIVKIVDMLNVFATLKKDMHYTDVSMEAVIVGGGARGGSNVHYEDRLKFTFNPDKADIKYSAIQTAVKSGSGTGCGRMMMYGIICMVGYMIITTGWIASNLNLNTAAGGVVNDGK